MASVKTRTYKADFYVVTCDGSRAHSLVSDMLAALSGDYGPAVALDGNDDEKHQIRSVVSLGKGKSFRGVFGRCRFNEKPLQGTADGQEEDVELKPGHGLVHKNCFLFFTARNLLVYQRDMSSGSHYMKLQQYLSQALEENIRLEPILTSDSYERLMNGPAVKSVDVSFQQPRDPSLYEDMILSDAVKMLQDANAFSARMTFSVGRTPSHIVDGWKDAAVLMAKHGLARVARVRLEDVEQPIDLIADRIVEPLTVSLKANGRADPDDIYAELERARSSRATELVTFFGK